MQHTLAAGSVVLMVSSITKPVCKQVGQLQLNLHLLLGGEDPIKGDCFGTEPSRKRGRALIAGNMNYNM